MNELPIGAAAPDFQLTDIKGHTHRLSDYAGQLVVLDFWSAECPWSRYYDAWLSEMAPRWRQEGIHLLAIVSNLNEAAGFVSAAAAERQIAFPVLLDSDCAVADLYAAQATPHIFVVDRSGRLAYRGAIDDRTFRQREPQVNYLERALDALRQGKKPEPAETAPYGCTIVRFPEA